MKTKLLLLAAVTLLCASCGQMPATLFGNTGDNGSTNSNNTIGTIADVLGSILGTNKMTECSIIGTWKYYQPGLAFESENLLSKAGGAVAAAEAKRKLQSGYASLGISAANTVFTFSEDKSFSGKINGLPVKGTYSLNDKTGKMALKLLLGTYNAEVRRSGTNGISLLFEGTKLLKLLQALAAFSGSTGLQTIGELSKMYDGMLIGFDMN